MTEKVNIDYGKTKYDLIDRLFHFVPKGSNNIKETFRGYMMCASIVNRVDVHSLSSAEIDEFLKELGL